MKKLISFIVTALFVFALPAGICFAADEGAAQTSPSPNLIVDSYSVSDKSIQTGDSFTLNFKLKNTSRQFEIKNILIHLSGGETFIPDGATDTLYTGSIAAGGSKSFSKNFYCSGGTDGGRYPISLSATFEYSADGGMVQGNAESNMSISVAKTPASEPKSVSLTPQLLITEFSYGGETIQGADTFDRYYSAEYYYKDERRRNICCCRWNRHDFR